MILLEAECDWANMIDIFGCSTIGACIILHRCTTALGLSYRLSIRLSADFIGKEAHAPAPRMHTSTSQEEDEWCYFSRVPISRLIKVSVEISRLVRSSQTPRAIRRSIRGVARLPMMSPGCRFSPQALPRLGASAWPSSSSKGANHPCCCY